MPETTKERLRAIATTLDPLRLLEEIRTVQHELAGPLPGSRLEWTRIRMPNSISS